MPARLTPVLGLPELLEAAGDLQKVLAVVLWEGGFIDKEGVPDKELCEDVEKAFGAVLAGIDLMVGAHSLDEDSVDTHKRVMGGVYQDRYLP